MRFYGLLFGVASEADSLFAEVDSCYGRLKKRAALSSVSLSIVSELKSGSAWYVPGGRSTIGRLFNDACGRMSSRKINIAVPFLWLLKQFLIKPEMPMSGPSNTIATGI